MFKKIAKKYIPVKYFDVLRSFLNKLNFFTYLLHDYDHLFMINDKSVHVSNIVRQYHRVEKSLAKIPYNSSRGSRAIKKLMFFLEKYEVENEIKDIQFYVAINVLHQVFSKNKDYKSEVYIRLKKLDNYITDIKTGIESTSKSYFINNSSKSFENLAKSRKSIRYFSDKKVDISLIRKALDISRKTPSVCNRQGWHTWVVSNPSFINHFRKIHNGFSNKEQNLSTLLVITFDKNVFDYPVERNQGYTDAGLYAMSVMYSFTSLGIASCPLNSNLLIKPKKEFKKMIGIPNNCTIAMFIAIGNYLDDNISPISYRYSVDDKTTFL